MHHHRLWPIALALLICAALIAPAAPARAAAPLEVSLISQYTGLTTQNYDCGPAAVAMLLAAYGKRPAGWTDKQLVQDVRARTGGTGTTGFAQLERALAAYGLSYSEIPNTLAPQPDAQMQAIKNAVAQRKPVITLVHGATLGRGEAYGDHWLVVRGFSDDGQQVYLSDPDTQAARWTGWIVGGQITLPYSTFRQAAYSAAPGPYGIIVGSGLPSSAPPATPGGLTISGATEQSLTLSWQAAGGASGYRIYRWAFAENRWDFFPLATTASTSYTQTGLPCANDFNYYLITAYNSAGESPRSGWVQGSTRACTTLAAPTGLTISGATASSLTLSWQAVGGASGYRIYRWDFAENRWDFFPLATTASTSYTQTGLPCANDFNFYLVTAFNAASESPRSGWVQGTTQACGAPATPAGLTISGATANSLTLGWQAVSGASGYRVYRWDFAENRWDFFPLATTAGTSYTQTGLPCANDFNFYLVTAYNSAGESPRGGWVQGATSACTSGAQAPERTPGPRPEAPLSTPTPELPPATPSPTAQPTPPPAATPGSSAIYIPIAQR